MLRVGLTGGLGSGKSTVATMLRELGAYTLSADEIARKLMEPGQPVFKLIAARFGAGVVLDHGPETGTLDRAALARIAFGEGRAEELNAIVHPATIELQRDIVAEIERRDPLAVVIVESALLFETRHGGGWRGRFDRMMLVTAPEELKVARFVDRSISAGSRADRNALEADARRRLAHMLPDDEKKGACDYVIVNDGTLAELKRNVAQLWDALQIAS